MLRRWPSECWPWSRRGRRHPVVDEGEQHPPHTSVRHDMTVMAVSLGRLDERLASIHRELQHHMVEEHRDFQAAREEVKQLGEKVKTLSDSVNEVHTAARVTRWIAGGAAGFAGFIVWIKDLFHMKPPIPPVG